MIRTSTTTTMRTEPIIPGWGGEINLSTMGTNNVGSVSVVKELDPLITVEESAAVVVTRKYGYAIMTMAVLVLAFLMVSQQSNNI